MRIAAITLATAAAVAALSACAAHPAPSVGQASPSASTPSPTASDCVLVDLALIQEEQVTVHLTNGSGRAGLGQQVASELANRGFRVAEVADGPEFGAVAALNFGPEGVGAAWLLTAYFLDHDLEPTFDPERRGADVDLVLGHGYEQLNTAAEVNQRIAAMGPPTAPPGTCGR